MKPTTVPSTSTATHEFPLPGHSMIMVLIFSCLSCPSSRTGISGATSSKTANMSVSPLLLALRYSNVFSASIITFSFAMAGRSSWPAFLNDNSTRTGRGALERRRFRFGDEGGKDDLSHNVDFVEPQQHADATRRGSLTAATHRRCAAEWLMNSHLR